jgi:DNA-binding MarR family transcriptional regulator
MHELDEEALATWRSFLTAHALITRRITEDLVDAGLPDLGWYDVLWAIYRDPDRRLQVGELAREVVLSQPGMSRLIDRMVKAGVVRREPVPGDRRAFHVLVTEKGVELLRRMWPVYAAGIERYFATNLPSNAGSIRRTLERMANTARQAS